MPGTPIVCGEIDGALSTDPPPSENGESALFETMHFYKIRTSLPLGPFEEPL